MAITTLDGVIAGMQAPVEIFKLGTATTAAIMYSPFYAAGMPGAATASVNGLAGTALTSYGGQIPYTNPAGGNSYLARFVANCNVAGALFLCDRLWHNSGIDPTSINSQTINSVAFPPRDKNGSVNGENVIIGAEVSALMGTGTPTWTMVYTNSQGVNQSVVTPAQVTAMKVGYFVPIQLAPSDTGVQSIQSWQQSVTMTSGVYSLVAYRVLARVGLTLPNIDYAIDALTSGFPRIYDNTVPFLLWLPSTTTAPTIYSQMIVTQG